jgi:hypothetical protein
MALFEDKVSSTSWCCGDMAWTGDKKEVDASEQRAELCKYSNSFIKGSPGSLDISEYVVIQGRVSPDKTTGNDTKG